MTADPYKLIETTAASVRRRMRENLVLPAVPPALAIAAAAALGRLPIEIAAAATIALGLLLLRLASQRFERREAATFLDARLGAKENFLTIATIEGKPTLRPAVERSATAIAGAKPPPSPPPRRTRPVLVSLFASILLLAFLWALPQAPLFASPEGSLDQIADELERAGDGDLARELRAVAGALHDPALSKDEKRKQVAAMIAKIDQAEKKKQQSAAAGSSGSGGSSGQQGGKGEQESREAQQKGAGKASGKNQQGQGGEQSGASARGEARKQLEKIAGELGGAEGEKQQQGKSDQGKEKKQEPSGGGIKGPENDAKDAKERKPSDRDMTGNQPGKDPNKSGGNESQGGSEGQSKADQTQNQQNQPNQANQGKGNGQGAGDGEGTSKQPSHAPNDKPAERFYKPGEKGEGGIVDGQYVRIRVPDDQHQLPGTDEVAAPGEVISEVPFGNAPLPPPGPPGDVATDQPVPLEYRSALGASK